MCVWGMGAKYVGVAPPSYEDVVQNKMKRGALSELDYSQNNRPSFYSKSDEKEKRQQFSCFKDNILQFDYERINFRFKIF